MANELAHDKMCALWEETAETTSNNQTFSKNLDVYNMSDMSDKDRAASASDNANDAGGSDREYIPQEYRFNVQDGIVSQDSDFQDIVDRMIPVNRGRAKRVLAQIDAKGLRDPQRVSEVAKGFGRDIANAVDLDCYQTAVNEATMIVTSTTAFDYQDAIDAEVTMLNYGLGSYNKKLFLSNTDYAQVAKDLGQKEFLGRDGSPQTAFERAQIPNLATFDTMRSDYRLNLPLSSAVGVTVNGAQEHTVATYDANGFFLDNRSMTLNLTGATTANMPVGTKFTVGVNYIDPETKQDSGELLTLSVITASNGSPVVQPAIVATGPYRNASAAAADGAAVVVLNIAASNPSLFYTPEAMRIIPGRLPVPNNAASVSAIDATTEQGLPMRMSYTYDFHKEVFNMKALVFYDRQVIYPNMLGATLTSQV